MKISVTQKNIVEGERGSCRRDPVALAMIDAKIICPWVSPTSISWMDKHGFKKSTETPEDVLQFMKMFDNGEYVEPFDLQLET